MPIICLMVRENHKMVREMSGKSQGILWGLMAGHPAVTFPSAAYMRWWTGSALFLAMAFRLFSASHYLKQCRHIVNWTLRNKLQGKSHWNEIFFIHGNALENVVYEMVTILFRGRWLNSMGPSNAIWRCRSWSTHVQVMACCLTAPSHYLNQCWLINSNKVLWHSSEDIVIRRFEDTNQ